MDQHFGERLGTLSGEPQPPTYSLLILVARDLLGCSKAATSHHYQKRAAHLLGRCAQPVHRRAVGLTEAGPTTFAMVALAAFERAVSHHVRCGAIGSRTGRFGIRGIHLAPPHSLSMPHILAESLPEITRAPLTQLALQTERN